MLSNTLARDQHRVLCETLHRSGVTCHFLPPAEAMPDLCFTRDVAVTTPWGAVLLNPAMPHRAAEVDYVSEALGKFDATPARRITAGAIEGGDICIARPGLLIVGISGQRTSRKGAAAFAEPFERAGWDIVHCTLDPHFLHLDTIFCMLDRNTALACVDVLDDGFLTALTSRGVKLIATTYKEARNLACNILSLDGRTILASAEYPRVVAILRQSGYNVVEVPISQFAACGGGIHCLTMPLARAAL